MTEQLIRLNNTTGGHLALWKMSSTKSLVSKNILLTHGTFSNRKVLNGIATYLVEHQFTCWIFEWRNHGESSRSKEKFDFETIGIIDFKIVFDYLFQECQLEKINCITHSGGGICLTIALIHHPHYQQRINSISLFACQAFGAGNSKMNLARLYLGKYASKILGYVPVRKVGGEENEPYFFMKQWFDWNLQGTFLGQAGVDYQEEMKSIKIPILSIYGAGDKFIAPPSGCEQFLAAFDNPANKSLRCGKAEGFAENFNHSRVLHSKTARKEIYPYVLDWIRENEGSKN